jgi:hypothetical protein
MTKEHSITVDEAKHLCRTKIKEAVAKYLSVVDRTRNDESLSLDLRRYVYAMQYSLGGNVAWSLPCLRHHAEHEHNDLQFMRMKHSIKKYSTTLLLSRKIQRSQVKAWTAP